MAAADNVVMASLRACLNARAKAKGLRLSIPCNTRPSDSWNRSSTLCEPDADTKAEDEEGREEEVEDPSKISRSAGHFCRRQHASAPRERRCGCKAGFRATIPNN